MGGGNLCIRLALPVAEAEEFLIPMRGGQRVYKPLRSGGESIGSSKSKARFSGQERLLGRFGIVCSLLVLSE